MSDSASGGMSAIVAIVAVIAIAVVGYFAVVMLRGENAEPGIDVTLPIGNNGGTGN